MGNNYNGTGHDPWAMRKLYSNLKVSLSSLYNTEFQMHIEMCHGY